MTVVIEKECSRCGRKNRGRQRVCPNCGLTLTRRVNNARFTARDPEAVYRTEMVEVPKDLLSAGICGGMWIEVIPLKEGGSTYYRAEIKAAEFADGVDGHQAMPAPTHPFPGYSDLAQAIGVADGWLQAMREGLTP